MDKILLHEYLIPAKGVKRKIVYHFSDTHLTEYDEFSSAEETEKAKKQTAAWENVRSGFASAYNEPYGENQRLAPLEHFNNLLTACKGGDALVIAGDMLDYVNEANLRITEKAMENPPCPTMILCGNHEKAVDIPDGKNYSAMKNPVQVIETEDMVILGIDDSKREITNEQLTALENAINGDKKVLLAMHIPIMTEGNHDALMKAGEYFRLNYEGCPEINHRFINLIKDNPEKFVAVLAGHLHFINNSYVADGVMQYVSTQGITGNLNKYVIGE